ncbi:hypothetical protein L580_3183 [Serratia fonticola AU-P3(3)]|nr:hypothetical protein L580_3183 [Serratia fonticola AU-P3(3)]
MTASRAIISALAAQDSDAAVSATQVHTLSLRSALLREE